MRKMKFFGLLLSFLLLIGTGIGLSAAFGNITVKLTYNVDNVDIEQADFSQAHGTTLTHEAPENVGDSGDFNYWLVNGILRTDLARNLSIVTRSTTELVAVYGHPTKPTVTFIDSNGKYINHLFVESGSVVASVPAAPGKPQSTFTGWKGLGSSVVISDPITTNTVFIATYTENKVTAELVVDGVTKTTYPINSVVSLTLGEGFTHWEDGDGNVLSYAETFKFSMLVANREVVRATGGVKEPVVNMIAETGLREGYTSYIGQFDSNGLDVIEYGFIISRSKDILTIDSLGATIIPSNVYNEQTNEFLRSFPEDSYNSIRAYAIFAGGVTVYSDNIVGGFELVDQLGFETGFEETTKTAYAAGTVDINEITWNLSDSLVGALADDKKVGDKAVRFRNSGFMESETAISNISMISYQFATYGTNTGGSIEVFVSVDGNDWIQVQSPILATANLAIQTINLKESTTLIEKGISTSNPLYVKFSKTGGDRVNLDELKIFTSVKNIKHEIVYNNEGLVTTDFVIDGSLIQDVSKEGYTFDGWFLEDTFETEFTGEVKQSLKLYAKFTIKSVTLTFDTDGGSLVDSITQNYGTAVTAPTDPIKEGYIFNGWSPALPATMPAGNQTFTAVWDAIQYTVTFETNGGDPVTEITRDFGTEVTLPIPTRTDFIFNGWYSDTTLETLVESLIMPLNGITLYAGWVDASTTASVSFMDGESTLFTEVVIIGTPVTRPTTDPTKDGYTFNNWYSDSSLTTLYNFDSNVETNISIYARWDVKLTYSVTVDTSGSYNSGISDGTIPSARLSLSNNGPGEISVVFAKNNSSTTTIFNNSGGEIRLYGGSGNGGQLTFSLTGYVITSITVNTSQNNGYSVNGGTTITTSEAKTEFTGGAASVTIKNVASSNAQVRITDIIIEYTKS